MLNRHCSGRRDTGFTVTQSTLNGGAAPQPGDPVLNAYTRTESREVRGGSSRRGGSRNGNVDGNAVQQQQWLPDDDVASDVSDNFEKDVVSASITL